MPVPVPEAMAGPVTVPGPVAVPVLVPYIGVVLVLRTGMLFEPYTGVVGAAVLYGSVRPVPFSARAGKVEVFVKPGQAGTGQRVDQ